MQILFNTLHNKNSQYQYIPFSGKTENFWKNYNKQFKNIALKETIKKSINNEENFLGEGMWKKGYNFSELKNYVIRVYKRVFSQEDLENKFIKPEKNPLNDLEEVVLTIPNKIDIVKKKFGKSLGVPKYTEKILTTNSKPLSNIIVNRKESLELLDSFEKLKDFPIKSYEKAYAQLKKFCSVQDYQFDPINPNNILIDVETKQINLIDPVTPTVNHPVHGKNRNFSKIHGSDSLYAVICDFLIHENHINNLKPEEIKRWDNAINTIIAKCIIAGKKNGLDSNIQELRNLYSRIGNFWETDQVTQKYDNLIKKYSRAIEQAHIIANAIDYKNNEKNRINAINQINIEDFKKIKNVFKTILKAPHQAKVEFPEIINATIDKIFEYKESAKIITPILEELFDKEIFCTTKKKLYNYFILYNPTNKKFLNEIEKSAENIFESNLFKEEFNLLYSRLEKLPSKKREAVNKI